jgi:hypothetical protein
MKFRLLSVLLVCLMATSVFAVNYSWISTSGGDWADGTAVWNVTPVTPGLYNDEYRFYGEKLIGSTATIGQDEGTYNGRIRLSGADASVSPELSANMSIVAGGSISVAEFRIGDGISGTTGGFGYVSQTGGTVNMIATNSGTSYSRNLIIGRGANSGPMENGFYTISGGTITYDNSITYNDAKLMVGASPNGTTSTAASAKGTFTVVGNAASITMKSLYVGSDASTYAARQLGTGTMEFQVAAAGVSKVVLDNAVILDAGGATSTANLVVSLLSTAPATDIVLIETKSATAVSGLFDTLNGGSAAEGAAVVLGGQTYLLTYVYDAVTQTAGVGNDIALLIPEPATIALLSLGLFAIRRRK